MFDIAIAILAGLLIGSFLNVCIFRMPRDLSPVAPRSFCPNCVIMAEDSGVAFEQAVREGQLAWYDNIPVVSWLLLGGKCRRCKAPISPRYPLVEAATAACFGIIVWNFGWTLPAFKYLVFSATMIALLVTDLEERILPDEFTVGGIIAGLLFSWWVPMPTELGHVLLPFANKRLLSVGESVIGSLALFLIWFTGWAYQKIRKREGMGMGDVKMIGTIGAFVGLSSTMVTLVFASLLGAVFGGAYIYLARKKASTYELPFGTFLGLAAIGIAAYGEWALEWYKQFL